MIRYDFLRNIILDSPNKICENCTLYDYLADELVKNPKFELLLAVCLIVSVVFVTIIYYRSISEANWYLIYVLGLQIFVIALTFKISKVGFQTEISNLDKKVYNLLRHVTEGRSTSMLSLLATMVAKLHAGSSTSAYGDQTNLSYLTGKTMPELAIPDQIVYDKDSPVVEIPKMAISEIEIPELEMPNAETPSVDIPGMEIPGMEIPGMDIPSVEVPGVEIPNVEVPTVEVPKIEIPEGTLPAVSKSSLYAEESPLRSSKKAKDSHGMKPVVMNTTKKVETSSGVTESSVLKSSSKLSGKVSVKQDDKKAIVQLNDKKLSVQQDDKKALVQPDNKKAIVQPNDKKLSVQPDDKKVSVQPQTKPQAFSPQESIHTDDEGVYFQDVIKVFNDEFTSNDKLAGNFKKISEVLTRVEGEIPRFDRELRRLIDKGNEAEAELRSFNVSTGAMENIRAKMIATLEKIMRIKEIMPNLNYKQSSDRKLNQIFNTDHSEGINKSQENSQENTVIITLQVLLIIEAVVCIVFFIQVLIGGGTYALRLITSILMIANLAVAILVMGLAHFYDKNCVLGRIGNCGEIFSKGFTQFAKFADLDLNSSEIGKIGEFQKALDKIEARTGKVATAMRSVLESNAFGEFKVQCSQLANIIDKINFVKASFTELTSGKIKRAEFYGIVNEVDNSNAQIFQYVTSISPKLLLDFYTKEAIFDRYLKSEKGKIIANSGKQLASPPRTNNGTKSACETMWLRICEKKVRLDQLSLLLLTGSFVFTLGFVVL